MANTYTQVHLHLIFAVQFRRALIHYSWKERLYQYITQIIQRHKHKVMVINGMPDHLHIVIGMRPQQSLSDLMQVIKSGSSGWVNEQNLTPVKFNWQAGYGAFSCSKSQLPMLINYVKNQEIHHRKKTFMEEYEGFLQAFEVEYDERYIFKAPED